MTFAREAFIPFQSSPTWTWKVVPSKLFKEQGLEGGACISSHGLNFRIFTYHVTFWSYFTKHVIRWRTDQVYRWSKCLGVGLKRPLDEKETINMVIKPAIPFLSVWRLQSWLAMKLTALKSKLYNFPLLHSLTSSLCYDTCPCFIGRNLDSRTTMLKDHASQWTYISQITTVFHEFFHSRSV